MQNSIQFIGTTPPELAVLIAHEVQAVLRPFLAQLQTPPQNQLLTRAEVCKKLNITPVTLWTYTRDGKLPSQQIGRRVLYSSIDVEAALRKRNFVAGGGAVK